MVRLVRMVRRSRNPLFRSFIEVFLYTKEGWESELFHPSYTSVWIILANQCICQHFQVFDGFCLDGGFHCDDGLNDGDVFHRF